MSFLRRCLFTKYAQQCWKTRLGRGVSSAAEEPKKTCLYDFHVGHGGKMVPFAGWLMPVQYSSDGIPASHLHTRSNVSVFDVSHMLQTKIFGKHRIEFMESLVVADIQSLKDNCGTLTLFTNEQGGIKDDLIVTKTDLDYLYVVSNAGCIDKDLAHMRDREAEFKAQGKDISIDLVPNGLLAVQGPGMVKALQSAVNINFEELPFMTSMPAEVYGVSDCRITRCGYTGEDGVEISIPSSKTADVAEALLQCKDEDVKLAGLGARDSLRLEAGLCLYGNDIDETTTPVEATLAWTISKKRRAEANFPGAQIILQQLKEKPLRKRVGFLSTGPPARSGTPIYDAAGERQIGEVTSGCPSPSLKKNISMGYVETAFAKIGTPVNFEVRKKHFSAEIAKMPFVPAKYYFKK